MVSPILDALIHLVGVVVGRALEDDQADLVLVGEDDEIVLVLRRLVFLVDLPLVGVVGDVVAVMCALVDLLVRVAVGVTVHRFIVLALVFAVTAVMVGL